MNVLWPCHSTPGTFFIACFSRLGLCLTSGIPKFLPFEFTPGRFVKISGVQLLISHDAGFIDLSNFIRVSRFITMASRMANLRLFVASLFIQCGVCAVV